MKNLKTVSGGWGSKKIVIELNKTNLLKQPRDFEPPPDLLKVLQDNLDSIYFLPNIKFKCLS